MELIGWTVKTIQAIERELILLRGAALSLQGLGLRALCLRDLAWKEGNDVVWMRNLRIDRDQRQIRLARGNPCCELRQSGFIAQACRDAKPLAKDAPVRLPGAAGLARKRRALAEGVALSAEIVSSLTEISRRLGIALPAARA